MLSTSSAVPADEGLQLGGLGVKPLGDADASPPRLTQVTSLERAQPARPEAPAMPAAKPSVTAPPKPEGAGMVDVSIKLNPNEMVETVLSGDVVITGSFRSTKGLLLRGVVEGDVIIDDKDGQGGTLIIDKDAKINGLASAKRMIVMGSINGPVVARELLELSETAKVNGAIRYARMRQAEGAEVEGMLTMIRDGADPTDSLRTVKGND